MARRRCEAHCGLDQHVRLVQAGVELCPPGLKICLNVLIVISIPSPHKGLPAQCSQCRVHPLPNGTEVLVLLVPKPEHSKGQPLKP